MPMPIRSGGSPRAERAAFSRTSVACIVERAADGALGVVRLGDRRAEVRHDAVPHVFVERAAVREDRFDHRLVVLVQHADDSSLVSSALSAVKSRMSLKRIVTSRLSPAAALSLRSARRAAICGEK